MSIGRDIYCDTLLMLEKLTELYPVTDENPGISATKPHDRALERLLEKWTDAVVFKYAAAAIPPDHAVMGDKNFTDDRKELWGRDWTAEHQSSLRPEALVNLRANMEFLEHDLLVEGQDFIFPGSTPTISDIHAAWIFTWLVTDMEALPSDIFSEKEYPKAFAWFTRYRNAAAKARKDMETSGKVRQLDGKDAVKEISEGPFGENQPSIDKRDPTGLQGGENVQGYPIDTGFTRKDAGGLVGLTTQEVVIASKADNGAEIRVHHPRWNFTVEKA